MPKPAGTFLLLLAALTLGATQSSLGSWRAVDVQRGYKMERIEFQKGRGPGQLYYDRHPVSEIVPRVLSVGPRGEFYVLEPRIHRVQTFSPDGKVVSAISLAELKQHLGDPRRDRGDSLINVFPVAAYRTKILAGMRGVASEQRYVLFTFQSDRGLVEGSVPLSPLLTDGKPVEMSFLDKDGYLWLFTDRWLIFSPDGKQARVAGVNGTYVDADGHLYLPGETVKVLDRHGVVVADLKPDPAAWVEIKGGDATSLLFAWATGLDPRKSQHRVEYPNILTLFRLEGDAQALRLVRRLELPSTILSYPGPNPDLMVPVQSYIQESGTLRGRHFYVLAHSQDRYWIDRIDLAP